MSSLKRVVSLDSNVVVAKRARTSKARRSYGFKGYQRRYSRPMVINSNLSTNQSFPESMISTVTSVQSFYIPASNAQFATGNYMSIMVNSIYTPFNTNFPISASGLSYSMRGVPVAGCGVGQNPVGYTNAANIYNNYVVLGYSMNVTVVPTVAADICRMAVIPLGQEEIPENSAANATIKVMECQPGAKALTCTAGSTPDKSSRLYLKGNCAKDLGMSKSTYESRTWPVTQMPSVAQHIDYVGVFLQEITGTVNAQPIVVTIHLSQIVKFSDINNPL